MSTLPEHFLFRLQFTARRLDAVPATLAPETLSADYRIPFGERFPLPSRAGANDEAAFDFRIGWHENGLILTAVLSGKKRPPLCERTRQETSDALSFFFDTRDVRDVHRATKFCHRFLFLPTETDVKTGGAPAAFWLPIHRAKTPPNPVDTARFRLAAALRKDGWSLSAFLPADTLTGYDPNEHSRVGFWYSLFDNELGRFNLQHPSTFPADEDPSLWSVLDLAVS